MAYLPVGDKPPPCQWHTCTQSAAGFISNSDGSDTAFLCSFHKRVAAINLEQYDRIHAPGKSHSGRRPGEPVPPPGARQIPKSRPGQEVQVEDWEREAAKKADSAAVPVEPQEFDEGELQKQRAKNEIIRPRIGELPKPRPER